MSVRVNASIYGFCVLALASIASPHYALAADSTPVKFIERSDDDLVLIELRAGKTVLSDSIPGYANKNNLMLPLGQLSNALQFAIKVMPREGQAEGWFLGVENTFSLDVAHNEVIIAGKRQHFTASQVEVHADEIYVDAQLLSQWFPLDFKFTFASQSLTVIPHEGIKLAAQEAAERDKQRSQLGQNAQGAPEGPFPRMETPYKLYTVPFSDVTYTSGYDQQTHTGLHNDVTALVNSDLLYMHSSIYATADETQKLSQLRWTLSRRDPDGKILQDDEWLKKTKLGDIITANEIRDVELGDINTQQMPLTALGQQGRGILVSNIPYDRATSFDRTTLQGDLPSSWDVELYRNDQLLSFQRASGNGRYEFVDVPLLSGLNVIRLVFYGPFGQTREEIKKFYVSDDLTPQGKSYFRASVSQQNTSSFDILTQNQNVATLSGVTPLQSAVVKGKPRTLIEYEYGILNNLSLFTNAASFTTPDDVTRNYISSGLATTIAGIYGRTDFAHDTKSNGNALQVSLQDNIYDISLSASHQQFMNKFISDYTESITDPVKSRTTARADTQIKLPYVPSLNNGVTASHIVYDSGRKVDTVGYRVATAIQRLALSNNLIYITDTTPTNNSLSAIIGQPVTSNPLNKQITGDFIMSFPIQQLIMRGDVIYGVTPKKDIQTLLMSGQYNFTPETNSILEVDRQLINQRLTTYTIGVNRKFEKFLLGANASHADNGTNAVGFTVSLSFGQDPRSGQFKLFPDATASIGIIAARAFQDRNGDGVFNEGDTPVENAKFFVNRGSTNAPTDKDGNVLLRNITPDSRSSILLDGKSLENPYLMSMTGGVDVVTRPGVPTFIDFPISSSGDIDGTVTIEDASGTGKPATNVQIELVGADGKTVKDTRTSFDGYYLLNGIPAGSYTVRVSPEQAKRLGFTTGPDRTIEIKNSEESSHVVDMVIKR